MSYATTTSQAPLLLDDLVGSSCTAGVQPAVSATSSSRRHEQPLARCLDASIVERLPTSKPFDLRFQEGYDGLASCSYTSDQDASNANSVIQPISPSVALPYIYTLQPYRTSATATSPRLHSLEKSHSYPARTGTRLPDLLLSPQNVYDNRSTVSHDLGSSAMLSASSSASSTVAADEQLQSQRSDPFTGGGSSSGQSAYLLESRVCNIDDHSRLAASSESEGSRYSGSSLAFKALDIPPTHQTGDTPLPSGMSHLPHARPCTFSFTPSSSSHSASGTGSGPGPSKLLPRSFTHSSGADSSQTGSSIAALPQSQDVATSAAEVSGISSEQEDHSRLLHNSEEWSQDDSLSLIYVLNEVDGRSWTEIAKRSFPNEKYSATECQEKWKELSREKKFINRGPWTHEEDEALIQAVNLLRPEKWVVIATQVTHRNGKQCRERWHNHLSPSIKKGPFTAEEDELIFHWYSVVGSKWSEIAKHLPGRPDNMIKNHFNTSLQRQKRRVRKNDPESTEVEEESSINLLPAQKVAGKGSASTSKLSTSLGEKFAFFAKQSRAASTSASANKLPPMNLLASHNSAGPSDLGNAHPSSPYARSSSMSPALSNALPYPAMAASAGPLTTTYSDRYRYTLPSSAGPVTANMVTSPTLPARSNHATFKPSYHPYARGGYPYTQAYPNHHPYQYSDQHTSQAKVSASSTITGYTPPATPDVVNNNALLPSTGRYASTYYYGTDTRETPASAPSNVEYFTVPRSYSRPNNSTVFPSASELLYTPQTQDSPRFVSGPAHAPFFGQQATTLLPNTRTQHGIGGHAEAPAFQNLPNFSSSEDMNRGNSHSSLGLLLASSQQTSPSTPQFATSTPSGQQHDFLPFGSLHSTAGQPRPTSPQTAFASDYRSVADGINEITRQNSIASSTGSLMSPMSVFHSPPAYHCYHSYPPNTPSDGTGATSLPSTLASFSNSSHMSHPSNSYGNNVMTLTSSASANSVSAQLGMYPSLGGSHGKPPVQGISEYSPKSMPSQLQSSANISGLRLRASSDIVTSHRQGNLSYHTSSSSYGGAGRFGAGRGSISTQSIHEEAQQGAAHLAIIGQREDPPLPAQDRDVSYGENNTEMH